MRLPKSSRPAPRSGPQSTRSFRRREVLWRPPPSCRAPGAGRHQLRPVVPLRRPRVQSSFRCHTARAILGELTEPSKARGRESRFRDHELLLPQSPAVGTAYGRLLDPLARSGARNGRKLRDFEICVPRRNASVGLVNFGGPIEIACAAGWSRPRSAPADSCGCVVPLTVATAPARHLAAVGPVIRLRALGTRASECLQPATERGPAEVPFHGAFTASRRRDTAVGPGCPPSAHQRRTQRAPSPMIFAHCTTLRSRY
jgi:hypothetical protein